MARGDNEPDVPETAETRRDWEVVQQDEGESKTERLKVRNGWLYRTVLDAGAVALVFVPGDL